MSAVDITHASMAISAAIFLAVSIYRGRDGYYATSTAFAILALAQGIGASMWFFR